MRKPKVLFVSEASYLASGYGTYANEILRRLHASGKVDFLEFGTFGIDDDMASLPIQWEFIGNLPDNKKPSS